ncbi:hypothetical protein B0H14DRAFT_2609968 [Mycena olivaceomarginata]|nr:hypothetical protein B0H14DRAFT_2609968 [Mycena olivaceomarginata]
MPSSNLDLIDSTRPSLLPLSVDHYTSCSRRTIAGDRWGENWIERNWLGRIFSGQPAEFAPEGFASDSYPAVMNPRAISLYFEDRVLICAQFLQGHEEKNKRYRIPRSSRPSQSPETVSLLGGAGDSPQKCDSSYGGLSTIMGLVQRQQEQRYLAPNGSHASKMCLFVPPTFETEILSWDPVRLSLHTPYFGLREWPESSSARIE